MQGTSDPTFKPYKRNPEDFLAQAGRLINEQKATVIVEHLTYAMIDEKDIFTRAKPKVNFSKAMAVDRQIYEYVFPDSETERRFVPELATSVEVVVYAKLPKSFHIPTPVGNHNPDLAIAFKDGAVKHAFFITETKGFMSSMKLRLIEDSKIPCARKFLSKITSDQVKYDVVKSYGKLMEPVK
ncbi:restriction endonuclease [Candidatus Laterigemmans baculatus]|uniref:restriction endonuclease n=1 Tax=Candidatus Laterigemmans baculatus TaxID=2770505 RepID=UPI0013DB6DD8|nr:type II restriction endonuclease [Candidatus Laterigemmans baculatus]